MSDSIPASTATGYSLSSSYDTYFSTIDYTGDTDWFSVVLAAGVGYQVWLEGMDGGEGTLGDPYLALYNWGGSFVTYNDDSSGRDPFLYYTPTVGGTYFLSVEEYGNNATGTYRITIESDALANTGSTSTVAVNGSVTGDIGYGVDTADWLRVNLVAGVNYQFDMLGSAGDGGSTLTVDDPWLALRNSSGTLIAADDDSGVGYNARLYYTPSVSGTYFLDAETAVPEYGTYTLVVNASPVAGTLAAGSSVNGSLDFAGDTDLYAVNLTAGTTYNFTLTGGTLPDPYLELLNASGDVLTANDDGRGLDSFLSYTPGSGGTFYLAARESGNNATGSYSLSASIGGNSGDDYAAGTATTGSVAVGNSVTGRIETVGDRDWFAVSLVAGQGYTFRLNAAASNGVSDPYLTLYNSAGSFLTYNDDGGGNLNSLLSYSASLTGTYYLEARAYGSQLGGYTLSTSGTALADTTAPTVLSFSPSDEATSVAVGANVTLTFSESIQRGTGTIYLKNAAGTVIESFDVAGSGRLSISGSTLTLDPTASLASATGYRVEFAAGTVRDLAGNHYAGTASYNFTTAASTGSDDYAANSATTGAIVLGGSATGHIETVGDRDWFAVHLSAGQTYTFRLNGAASNGLWDPYLTLYNSAGTVVTYNDDGGGGLNSLLSYTVGTGGTYYLEARGYSTQLGDYVLSASGTDVTAPTVLSFSPADEAASVAVGSNVTLTFSEAIQRGTGTIHLKNAAGTTIESFDAATSARVSISGATLTIDATANLAHATGYRVEFGAGTVRDLAGNAYAGTASYNFTTVGATGGDDYAANTATNGALAPGGSATGHIETAGDRDWFAVNLVAGQAYAFRLDGAATSNGLWDPYLSLYNSGGSFIASNDDGGSNLNSLLNYTADANGTYYLEARAYGSRLGDYVLSASGTDVTAPTVLSFSPADEAGSVALGANIVLNFSEAIQRGAGTMYLKNAAGAVIESFDAATSGRIAVSGSTLTLDPTASLASATGYRMEFAAGTVRDLAGNNYAGISSYNFTTVADTTAPTVTSFSPADEATSAAVSANIALNFSEAIQRGTGTISLKNAAGTVIESFNAATSGRVSISGSTLTIDPMADLATATGYRVEFETGTVRDLAGNSYAGTTSYNFTTVSAGGDDFAASTATTGSVTSGGTVTGDIETAGDRDWFAVDLLAGQTYTFRLSAAASNGLSDPYLSLYNGAGSFLAFDDDGGGNLGSLLVYTAAMSGTYYLEARAYGSRVGDYVLATSAAAATDTTAPTVLSFSPADESTSVPVGANIALAFSEAIQRGTGTIYLKNAAGLVIEAFDAATSARLSVSGSSLTINPTADLSSGTGYRVEFAAGTMRDFAGNAYAGTTGYNFTTGADSTAPTVVSFSPADEAASVAVGSNVALTFSEAVQRGTGTIYLKNAAGAVIESFDAATSSRLSISGSSLTLDPTSDLANATGYRVEFGSGTVRDFAGNAYAGTAAYNFTTVIAAGGDDYAASTLTAASVAVGGGASGHVEAAGDRDWFAVSLTAGQAYTFRLNGAGSNALSDPFLTLYNGASTAVASNDDGDNGYNSLITYTAAATGTYYLEARGYGSQTGEYSVSATATTATGGGTGTGTSGFSITIHYTAGNSAYRSYFEAAAARWAEVIIGDLPDVSTSAGLVDDLVIDASVVPIDGVSGILGQAGFTALRGSAAGGLPYQGKMEFDQADVANMVANGTFGSVVLHEMGHVLGLSDWMWQRMGLVSSGNIYQYTGANAVLAYDSITAAWPYTVPLETTGGEGTAAAHWSEAVFDKELMTGYAESSPPMPLSVITVGALADLGYVVNYAAADPYVL